MATETERMQTGIKAILKERKRSLRWLAEEVEISYPTMRRRMQPGGMDGISLKELLAICEAFNMTLGDLHDYATNRYLQQLIDKVKL
ncbi:helix-turn-helix transcriptional regulator [Leucobacter sp. OH1287]|uniref:helix-turn-helix domain-containing protein n=1 Tax=Leucobacter sp. OH1287 TaxID=2491049 RepID=UPI000F5D5404|nr:helix-turn-helix transcriptional regulator [Leucobacter sp. OH1287]RRD61659.1 XRE family transcriptional regulator [Leucobacter sp. OH1287]